MEHFAKFLMPAMAVVFSTMAHALDCAAIKSTDIPYEMMVQKDDITRYPVQVYRGANLTRRQLTVINHQVSVAKFQANFQTENVGANGETIVTAYNVPTDNYIWTQSTRVVHGRSLIDGKPSPGPGFEATYTMLPDDVVVLGACPFPVKHYTVVQKSPSLTMTSDVRFSPELNTILRTRISTLLASTGKITHTELEARSIATEFTPFR